MKTLKQQIQKKAIRFADLVIQTNQKYGHSWNPVQAKIENQLWIKVEDAEKIEIENRKEWLKQLRSKLAPQSTPRSEGQKQVPRRSDKQ